MISISSQNINQAFYDVWWRFKTEGVKEMSRNGEVLVMPTPVMTTYRRPEQRVLFNPRRDANAIFHLVEAIWMLAGRNDSELLTKFNKRYFEYAEGDGHVHGAYGYRWRHWWPGDQILGIIHCLRKDPNSRQAVMQMWDAASDLNTTVKDRPCNTHVYFDCRGGKLNMTVCNRSNDVLWGAYGANVVHFSMLQEVIAWGVALPMGVYRQFSNNFHIYTDVPMVRGFLDTPPYETFDYYNDVRGAKAYPMFQQGETVEDFLAGCESMCTMIMGGSVPAMESAFLREIAWPLAIAYLERQKFSPDWRQALKIAPRDCDWKMAFNDWIARRDHQGK